MSTKNKTACVFIAASNPFNIAFDCIKMKKKCDYCSFTYTINTHVFLPLD